MCDTHERCPVWKEEGECIRNTDYMTKYCPASCAQALETSGDDACKDSHANCHLWAQAGECKVNKVEMFKHCPKSCGKCGDGAVPIKLKANVCEDQHEKCEYWASLGECEANPNYMETNCELSCGMCEEDEEEEEEEDESQEVAKLLERTLNFGVKQEASGSQAPETLDLIRESIEYMDNEANDLPPDVLDNCLNRKELCAFWALVGECKNNPAFMVTNCAPSCKTCHLIDMESRCPPLPDAVPALRPGDLNKMFQRIMDEAPGNRTLTDQERKDLESKGIPEYTVHVYSRPTASTNDETLSREVDMAVPPWVIYFDNFTTPEECHALIELGYKEGYERSKDVGPNANFDGTFDGVESTGRTSKNAWCSHRSGCRDDETAQRVMNRMGSVMGIPPENSEDFQLLKYEVGQFYRSHHDYILHQRDRQCGPRILTFFLYLSDVEQGGGTSFSNLGITVTPKMGRAVLWPSVFNSDPMEKDPRTVHAALEVKEGTKFAANGW